MFVGLASSFAFFTWKLDTVFSFVGTVIDDAVVALKILPDLRNMR